MTRRANRRAALIAAFAIPVVAGVGVAAGWDSRVGSISGIVVTDSADPRPIRLATIRVSGAAGTTTRLVGTDANGRFRIDALPNGKYTVSATKVGFVAAFHGSTQPGRGPGTPVAIADGQTIEITLKMLPGGVITGALTDANGQPAAGVQMTAVDGKQGGGLSVLPVRATTDDLGVYRLFGLAPGEYFVVASPRLLPVFDGRGMGRTGGAVPLVTAADVQWARGVASGVGAPVPPPATRTVAYAPVFYPGTANVVGATVVRVASGEERGGVSFQIHVQPMSRLGGRLMDGAGQDVNPAAVNLYPRRSERPMAGDALTIAGIFVQTPATVSATGFAFAGVAPGEYTLVARSGGPGLRGAAPPSPATQPVTLWNVTDVVVDGSDRDDLLIRMLPGLTLSGSIAFEGATAERRPKVDGIELTLAAVNPLPNVAIPRAVTTADGTFRFVSIPPGSYVVRAASAAGADARWSMKSAVIEDRDRADHPFTSAANGEERDGLVVTFSDRTASISGRVTDAAGRPLTRHPIVVFTTDQSLWLPNSRRVRVAQPATDGSYSIDDLPAGEYAIAAVLDLADLLNAEFLNQLLAASFKVRLAHGEKKRQDIQGK